MQQTNTSIEKSTGQKTRQEKLIHADARLFCFAYDVIYKNGGDMKHFQTVPLSIHQSTITLSQSRPILELRWRTR